MISRTAVLTIAAVLLQAGSTRAQATNPPYIGPRNVTSVVCPNQRAFM